MRSKYFKIHELAPKELYEKLHEDILWKMFDPNLILEIDNIKEQFPKGSMTINNYVWGGSRKWSGIRTKKSKYYSEGSQHSIGCAVDIVFSEYETDEVRDYIINNSNKFWNIRRIEGKVSWLHIDTKPTDTVGIVIFNP